MCVSKAIKICTHLIRKILNCALQCLLHCMTMGVQYLCQHSFLIYLIEHFRKHILKNSAIFIIQRDALLWLLVAHFYNMEFFFQLWKTFFKVHLVLFPTLTILENPIIYFNAHMNNGNWKLSFTKPENLINSLSKFLQINNWK